MTYLAQEGATETGRPVELYLLEAKEGTEFTAITSGNVSVTYDGKTYAPTAMKRTSFKLSTKSSSGNLTITVPTDNSFVQRYKKGMPPLPDELTIFRNHLSDTDSEVIPFWKGDVVSVTFEKDVAKITLKTISARLQRPVPKRTYSWACNHVLYDSGCQVGAESFRSDAKITAIGSDQVTLDLVEDGDWTGTSMGARWAADNDFFNGGYCEVTIAGQNQRRTVQVVTNSAGLQCVLSTSINDLTTGATLRFYAGCNHSVVTCKDKFNNVNNYGGCPFVPTRNPFSTGVITED